MKLSEIEICPFCGHTEFYTNDYYTGTSRYYQRFDGEQAYDNSQMYDGLMHRSGARAYCGNCEAYIGSVIEDKLGRKAEEAMKKRLLNAEQEG